MFVGKGQAHPELKLQNLQSNIQSDDEILKQLNNIKKDAKKCEQKLIEYIQQVEVLEKQQIMRYHLNNIKTHDYICLSKKQLPNCFKQHSFVNSAIHYERKVFNLPIGNNPDNDNNPEESFRSLFTNPYFTFDVRKKIISSTFIGKFKYSIYSLKK
jgi:hypothetical protein